MLPRIKRVEFKNVHVNDEIYTNHDLLLHQSGVETITPSRRVSMEDFERILLHEPQAAVFGVGFREKVTVDKDVLGAAKDNNIDVFVMPTPEAAKKFQELSRKGKKVIAKLHVTC